MQDPYSPANSLSAIASTMRGSPMGAPRQPQMMQGLAQMPAMQNPQVMQAMQNPNVMQAMQQPQMMPPTYAPQPGVGLNGTGPQNWFPTNPGNSGIVPPWAQGQHDMGQNNDWRDQWQQAKMDWRGQRPDHTQGMDPAAWHTSMMDWRGQRPDRQDYRGGMAHPMMPPTMMPPVPGVQGLGQGLAPMPVVPPRPYNPFG